MASAPYKHVEAPRRIRINGELAFAVGDPVPYETAERLGLLKDYPGIEVFGDSAPAPSTFKDAAIPGAAEKAAQVKASGQ